MQDAVGLPALSAVPDAGPTAGRGGGRPSDALPIVLIVDDAPDHLSAMGEMLQGSYRGTYRHQW